MACLSIIACNKKEIGLSTQPETNSIITDGNSNLKQNVSWGICCVWNGVDDCVKPAVNCFEPVIITPKYTERAKAKHNFDSLITLGPKGVANFFYSDDAKKLFPDLTCVCDKNPFIEYLNKLTSGNYYITTTQKGNKFYYLVKPNGTNNVDFVLVIKEEGIGNN